MTITNSPWGAVDYQSEHAPGITFVSTPSHGGYHLSPERRIEFLTRAPEFAAFRPQWLEEDCEAVLVYLCWPHLATDEQLDAAEETVRMLATWPHAAKRWAPIVAWLDHADRQEIRDRAQAHRDAVSHLWERGGMSSATPEGVPRECWSVYFYRRAANGGKNRRTVYMAYPTKRYYTTEELDELDHPAPPKPPEAKHPSGFPRHTLTGNSYDFSPSDADPGL